NWPRCVTEQAADYSALDTGTPRSDGRALISHSTFGSIAAMSSAANKPSVTSTGTPITQAGHSPVRKRTHKVAIAAPTNRIDHPTTPHSAEVSPAMIASAGGSARDGS